MDDTALHHEADVLERADVAQWIAWYRDDVGQLARGERPYTVQPSHDFRVQS